MNDGVQAIDEESDEDEDDVEDDDEGNQEEESEEEDDDQITKSQPQNQSNVTAKSAQTSLQKVPEKDRNQASMRLK